MIQLILIANFLITITLLGTGRINLAVIMYVFTMLIACYGHFIGEYDEQIEETDSDDSGDGKPPPSDPAFT